MIKKFLYGLLMSLLFITYLNVTEITASAAGLPTMPLSGYDQGGRFPAGKVESINYNSPVTKSTRKMVVYTPPGYSTTQKYPVIYAIHGIGAWPETIFDSWCVGASAVSDNLLGEKKIEPVIIVAMDNNNVDSHRELFEAIIPYVESHYPVIADADHRGIYGYSLGGGVTFAEGIGHLDTFHHISPSSAAPFNHPSDADMFPNGGAEAKKKIKTLLLSCGTADWDGFYPPNAATHKYCDANGIPNYWLSVEGGGHDGGVWRPAMWNFLQLAFPAKQNIDPRSAFTQIEAESFNTQSGIETETCTEGGQDVGYIENGDYVVYDNIDFGNGAGGFQARVASGADGGNIEIRLDNASGQLVGTSSVKGTGGWQTWTNVACNVSGVSGKHSLYLKFTGGSGYLLNINWIKFTTGSVVGKLGDLNSDGVIDSLDLVLMKKHLLGLESLEKPELADLDTSRTVDSLDFSLLKKFLLGK